MARLLAIYRTPKDPAAFDRHYFDRHVPIAMKIPGLRSYEVNNGVIGTPVAPGGVHLVATLEFDDLAAINAAFASPEGQAAAADLANFADGGVELLAFDTKTI